MWEMYRLKYHQDLNVVATQEGNFQRNRRHLNQEKESTETPNNGDTDKPNEDNTNQEKQTEEESSVCCRIISFALILVSHVSAMV